MKKEIYKSLYGVRKIETLRANGPFRSVVTTFVLIQTHQRKFDDSEDDENTKIDFQMNTEIFLDAEF